MPPFVWRSPAPKNLTYRAAQQQRAQHHDVVGRHGFRGEFASCSLFLSSVVASAAARRDRE